MKYYYTVPFLAAAALAQSQSDGPNCGIVTDPPLDDNYPASSRVIAVAIVAINESTVALNQSINTFDGTPTAVANLQDVANAVLADIQTGNTNVSAIPGNGDDDQGQLASFALVTYVGGLACTVNATVDNLIDARQALIDACVGPIVLQNIQQQQTDSLTFEATVKSKISPSLQDLSDTFVQPINVALSSAVSVFADQTTLPASCGSSTTTTMDATTTTIMDTTTTVDTTTTTDATTTSDVSTTASGIIDGTATGTATGTTTGTTMRTATGGATGGATGTLSVSATGTGVVYPTVGSGAVPTGTYGEELCDEEDPTGSKYEEEEDCDCEDEVEEPTEGASEEEEDCDCEDEDEGSTGGSGSYPVDGSSPKPSSPDAEWEAVSYPASNPSHGAAQPKPSSAYDTWEAITVPTGGSPSKPGYSTGNPSQPVYTSGKAPAATTTGSYDKYTGAATANIASGMGAAAVAALAAIALL